MSRSIEMMSDCSERVPYNMACHPAYARNVLLSHFKGMGAASHWHDDLEFGVVLSGHMVYQINGSNIALSQGQGIFINARQLHGNFSADGSDCGYTCVLIHPSLLCASPYLEAEYITPLITNSSFPYCTLSLSTPWQASLMAAIQGIEAAFSQDTKPGLTGQSMMFQAVSCLYDHMPHDNALAGYVDRRQTTLRNMVGYIQLHYDKKITLGDIAAAGSISKSSCCDIFQQQLQQTPVGYLTRYRLEKAMALLAQPDLSLIEVALTVGFASASYFTETFHKHMGLTPSAYRSRIHKSEAY